MADVLAEPRPHRHQTARLRRRRDDIWVGTTALIAAMLALPFAQNSWHGPEVASVLAVAATALFAGQRWAIGVIVIAELLLLPTVMPRAFLADGAMLARTASLATLFAIVPGVLSMRRAAAALVLVTGFERTGTACRRFHAGLVVSALLAASLPFV